MGLQTFGEAFSKSFSAVLTIVRTSLTDGGIIQTGFGACSELACFLMTVALKGFELKLQQFRAVYSKPAPERRF